MKKLLLGLVLAACVVGGLAYAPYFVGERVETWFEAAVARTNERTPNVEVDLISYDRGYRHAKAKTEISYAGQKWVVNFDINHGPIIWGVPARSPLQLAFIETQLLDVINTKVNVAYDGSSELIAVSQEPAQMSLNVLGGDSGEVKVTLGPLEAKVLYTQAGQPIEQDIKVRYAKVGLKSEAYDIKQIHLVAQNDPSEELILTDGTAKVTIQSVRHHSTAQKVSVNMKNVTSTFKLERHKKTDTLDMDVATTIQSIGNKEDGFELNDFEFVTQLNNFARQPLKELIQTYPAILQDASKIDKVTKTLFDLLAKKLEVKVKGQVKVFNSDMNTQPSAQQENLALRADLTVGGKKLQKLSLLDLLHTLNANVNLELPKHLIESYIASEVNKKMVVEAMTLLTEKKNTSVDALEVSFPEYLTNEELRQQEIQRRINKRFEELVAQGMLRELSGTGPNTQYQVNITVEQGQVK